MGETEAHSDDVTYSASPIRANKIHCASAPGFIHHHLLQKHELLVSPCKGVDSNCPSCCMLGFADLEVFQHGVFFTSNLKHEGGIQGTSTRSRHTLSHKTTGLPSSPPATGLMWPFLVLPLLPDPTDCSQDQSHACLLTYTYERNSPWKKGLDCLTLWFLC